MAYKNRKDQRAYGREHYQQNKATYKARAAEHSKNVRAQVRAYKGRYLHDHPCADCGERDPIVLEFDHRDPRTKKFCIGEGVSRGYSLRSVKAEITKCDIRCANCHRRRSHREGHYAPSRHDRRRVKAEIQLTLTLFD